MSQEVIVAVEAALQAGKILRERVNDIGKVSFKEFHDPVTEVDHLAEKTIITRIKKTFPDHDILAEESGNAEGSDSTSKWIIDPARWNAQLFPWLSLLLCFNCIRTRR